MTERKNQHKELMDSLIFGQKGESTVGQKLQNFMNDLKEDERKEVYNIFYKKLKKD
jgi:hypothetical protein